MSKNGLDFAEMDGKAILLHYYLKEELVEFCRLHGLQISGSKSDLNERIAHYLDTGQKTTKKIKSKRQPGTLNISEKTMIGEAFVCAQINRHFFEDRIKNFRFTVSFQKWLKDNSDKTYGDAVNAYMRITEEGKTKKAEIGKQFEYNAYIRDFFEDNNGKSFNDAILCWKYKKSQSGHKRYERTDLAALK